MTEFWEQSFKDKQEMWGWEPADSAVKTLELFKGHGFHKVLIPGFGYGRNAKIFIDNGFDVTGIEIAQTAIDIAREQLGDSVKVYHGSVDLMPFDQEVYDGIFSYALLHLLPTEERQQLIANCYKQLKVGGVMVFVSLSKMDFRYGQGNEVSQDTFESRPGVNLFFYDADSIESAFAEYGLKNAQVMNEPVVHSKDKPAQGFWYIICQKGE
jgi:SAM-dependent methyltransferase